MKHFIKVVTKSTKVKNCPKLPLLTVKKKLCARALVGRCTINHQTN